MLDLGIPISVVARRLDHRRVSTTLDFYTHVITGRDRFAADSLASLLHTDWRDHHTTTRRTTAPAAGLQHREAVAPEDRHNE